MKNLLLTLGHNSSAIMVEDNEIKWGYETERVTGVKSDSHFPKPAIDYAKKMGFDVKPDIVYATHWAPDGLLQSMSAKHWTPTAFDGVPVRTLRSGRSHHDCHMAGAVWYAGPWFPMQNTYGFVVDGFGIYGEHLSIYKMREDDTYRLVERVHGYGTSLGLFYQYATAFMGMKMYEDEYKLLGYEAHIDDRDASILEALAHTAAVQWLDDMSTSIYGSKYDPLYSLAALANVKQLVFQRLTHVMGVMNFTDPTSFESRVKLSFYVQSLLEQAVLNKISQYSPTNVLLSGGCFMNVKLNMRIMNVVQGKTCVYPLCGDQGNALGLYYMDNPDFMFPGHLNWGHRKLQSMGDVPGLSVMREEAAFENVVEQLDRRGYVNLVRGSMEFGPRSLCNTTTLAKPCLANVDRINSANERNGVMPMAPAMTLGQYRMYFESHDKVWKSCNHMVMAMEYKEHPLDGMLGVAHCYHYPRNYQTGRPQIVGQDDSFMNKLLAAFGPLINTSFNFHGKPIALGMEEVIDNHLMQLRRDDSFNTVVIRT